MNLEPIAKRAILATAVPELLVAVVFGATGLIFTGLVFLFGTFFGPFVVWFLDPLPRYVPAVFGILLIVVSVASVLHADFKYWTNFTYYSRSRGEIPFAEAQWKLHTYTGYNLVSALCGFPQLRGAGLPADMDLFRPASINMLTKIVSIPLLIGPALVIQAIRSAGEAYRLLSAKTQYLSSVLTHIYRNGGRTSFDDLCEAFPGFDPERDARMLSVLDGVVILHEDMQGIALADRLKERIRDQVS